MLVEHWNVCDNQREFGVWTGEEKDTLPVPVTTNISWCLLFSRLRIAWAKQTTMNIVVSYCILFMKGVYIK